MSEPLTLTPNEARIIELLRVIKANNGHGQLTVKVTAGMETLFEPMRSEKPPERQKP